ncbi:MAG: FmdB family transcriptional regulator [Acidobacteria bacterium]|nr:MAG: FmdB family transcriptional regulator [Acidobacteriota bacterium]
MPHCEFMCLDCHKGFLKTLTSHDYECPHCGSSRVELRITLPAKAKRKSA